MNNRESRVQMYFPNIFQKQTFVTFTFAIQGEKIGTHWVRVPTAVSCTADSCTTAYVSS